MYQILPPEDRWITDLQTGQKIHQLTSHASIQHHPFFLSPAWDDSMQHIAVVSDRTGHNQLYLCRTSDYALIRISDVEEVDEWTVHPSRDGRYIYYHGDAKAIRTECSTGKSEVLLTEEEASRLCGGVGKAVFPTGRTTALSKDDRYWAIRAQQDGRFHVLVYDTEREIWKKEWEAAEVSHMQFCPDASEYLFCAGTLQDRVWVLDRRTGEGRRVYKRNAAAKQWITHETWIPGTMELSLVDWPHGILAVHCETGKVRRIADFNAWHAISNEQGTMMAADTNFPDVGIRLLDPRSNTGAYRTLCYPRASCMGEHWNGPFPYDDGPVQVYAPQYTHPHPRFSPNGQSVLYTSDCTGYAQIYVIDLTESLNI